MTKRPKAKPPRAKPKEQRAKAPVLAGVNTCVFDAYGTLFDFSTAAGRYRKVLRGKTDLLTDLWRQKQLQYTWLRSLMGKHADFWEVTRDALEYALDALNLKDQELKEGLLEVYMALDAFSEVKQVLGRIKDSGKKTAVLSNGSPIMLRAAVGTAGMTALIDEIISIEEVGMYKPHPSVYRQAVVRLGAQPNEIAYLSANGWDAHGGASFGFHAIWVNRNNLPVERVPTRPKIVIKTLDELPSIIGLDT
ncbi:MAG: haloacid dehalogenase type II [Alphaproteobacteria bacterium]|nr:haloacid dehalogenase type II [Alphaproteobacteria bacterium]